MGKIKVNMENSYKLGMNEVEGLKNAMTKVFKPIEDILKSKMYWNESGLIYDVEYKSRDGFIAHSHNCGGLMIRQVIPKCEEYEFSYLEFGECDECSGEKQCGYEGMECGSMNDGLLDASLRIWFKFEGYNKETGELEFYLCAGGGNGDAPYFRTQYEQDLFEASFACKSIEGLKRASSKHIKALANILK
jgi:hypothetical protein